MASRSDNLPRRFARIYTAAITDVMDELGLQRQTLPWAIQPLTADMRLAGYAFTARGRPYRGTPRDRDTTLRLFLRMLGAAPADSVLVLASGDNAAAHFGELSAQWFRSRRRSEEHTSELQSRGHLVCRLLLEKKKKHKHKP